MQVVRTAPDSPGTGNDSYSEMPGLRARRQERVVVLQIVRGKDGGHRPSTGSHLFRMRRSSRAPGVDLPGVRARGSPRRRSGCRSCCRLGRGTRHLFLLRFLRSQTRRADEPLPKLRIAGDQAPTGFRRLADLSHLPDPESPRNRDLQRVRRLSTIRCYFQRRHCGPCGGWPAHIARRTHGGSR